jgi:hypothetical protein
MIVRSSSNAIGTRKLNIHVHSTLFGTKIFVLVDMDLKHTVVSHSFIHSFIHSYSASMCFSYIFHIFVLIMKRKFKQWWSTFPPISTQLTTTSDLTSLNIKQNTTYDVGNIGPDMGQTQKYGRVHPCSRDYWTSNGNTYMSIIKKTYSIPLRPRTIITMNDNMDSTVAGSMITRS